MWRNDIKCRYMFMFTLKSLACKGLRYHNPLLFFSLLSPQKSQQAAVSYGILSTVSPCSHITLSALIGFTEVCPFVYARQRIRSKICFWCKIHVVYIPTKNTLRESREFSTLQLCDCYVVCLLRCSITYAYRQYKFSDVIYFILAISQFFMGPCDLFTLVL